MKFYVDDNERFVPNLSKNDKWKVVYIKINNSIKNILEYGFIEHALILFLAKHH